MVRYFDPDTFEIIESDLPNKLYNISEDVYSDNFEYVQSCYDESGFLKENLSEKTKHKLSLIFKDVAYRQFLFNQESELDQPTNGDEL